MKKSVSIIALTFMLFSSSAFASKKDGDEIRGPFKRIYKELNLTQDQKTKLKEIHAAKKQDAKALRGQLHAAMEEMKKAMEGNANSEALKKQHANIQEIKAKLNEARFNSLLTIREILTPEQRSKFHELKGKRGKKFKKKCGIDNEE